MEHRAEWGWGHNTRSTGGGKVPTLLWEKCGELGERADGVIWVLSGRVGNSIRRSVDGGVGYGIGS